MENASGEREQECWFEEGGCIESSEMESGSWRDCCQSGVNLATLVYGGKPGSKLELKLEYLQVLPLKMHTRITVQISTLHCGCQTSFPD